MKKVIYLGLKLAILVIFITMITSIIGCATAMIFTPNTRNQLDDFQIKKVQYFISSTITLTRELVTGEAPAVKSGRISFVNGKQIEQIIITANTPGVLINIWIGPLGGEGEWEFFDICFESDDNDLDKCLTFVKEAETYSLVYRGGTPPYTKYGYKLYKLTYTGDVSPYLLGYIDSKYLETKDVRKAQGRFVE